MIDRRIPFIACFVGACLAGWAVVFATGYGLRALATFLIGAAS